MADEFKITPSSPQPNFIPADLEPLKESEGFQIDDTPAMNERPVNPSVNWDDVQSVNKPDDRATRNQVFAQASAPTKDYKEGDVWFDTDDNNKPYRANSALSWVSVQDAGSITSARLDLADRGWTQTCAFSVTDADTVAWGAGTFTASDGTAYSIGAGNTGNMAARTYIYLDTAVSTTAYQVTTTAATAVGTGKVLVATAVNGTSEARFQVFSGNGGLNIDGADVVPSTITGTEISDLAISTSKLAANAVTAAKIEAATITSNEIASTTIVAGNIVAGTITGNEIAASTITSGKLSVSQLSAITADLGTITAGTVTGGTVQTSSVASTGIKFTSTAIQGFNASNVKTFELLATTGALVYEGYLGKTFTAGEALTANDAVYVKSADGKVYKTDADFSDERITRWIGFAVSTVALGASVVVAVDGILGGFTLTAGDDYFLSGTAGAIANTPGTNFQSVGFAVSTTELLIGENFAIDESGSDIGITTDVAEYSRTSDTYGVLRTLTFSAGSFYKITKVLMEAKVSSAATGAIKSTYQAGAGTETLIEETTGITATAYSSPSSFYNHDTTPGSNTDKDDNLVIRVYGKTNNVGDTVFVKNISLFGTKAIRI